MKRKVLSILILGAMVFSMGGCSKNSTETSNKGGDTSSTKETSDKNEKPIEIKYFLPDENMQVPITDDLFVFKAIEEKTNVKIKTIPVPLANYSEKLSTTLASGDLPDLMAMRGDKYPKQYGPEGAFANLSSYIEEGKMPNLKKYMDSIENSYIMAKATDGNIYGAPRIYDYTWITESMMYRYDIFKKHNIEIPKNFDDLYESAKKLKSLYPDSSPITNRWGTYHIIGGLAKFHHTEYSMYYNGEKKEWVYGPLEDGFKETLIYMRKLYKEGLLDKEFATLADAQWDEKFVNDKAFITYDYLDAGGELHPKGIAINKDFDFSGGLPLEYKGKTKGTEVLNSCYVGYNKCIAETSKYKDELVKFLDWTYSEEGINITNFGKEGETYKKNGENIEWADMIKTNTNQSGSKTIYDLGLLNQNIFSVKSKDSVPLKDEQVKKAEKLIMDAKLFGTPEPSLSFTDSDLEEKNNMLTPIETLKEETALKIITGTADISEWDKALEKMKGMGIEKVIKIYNDTYKKMYNK